MCGNSYSKLSATAHERLKMVVAVLLVAILIIFGHVGFMMLELGAEEDAHAEDFAKLQSKHALLFSVASLYNISAAHYMALAKAMDVDPVGGGHPHHLSVGAAAVERPRGLKTLQPAEGGWKSAFFLPEQMTRLGLANEINDTSLKPSDKMFWDLGSPESMMFSFTIMSTIGYGNISPKTTGGRIFACCFAMVSIPVAVLCFGLCAAQVLAFFEYMAVKRMDVVKVAFDHYDEDSSGALDLKELRHALSDLEIEMTDEKFEELVDEVDDGDGEIDMGEFVATVAKLNLPLGRAARVKVRLQTSIGLNVFWILFGVLTFGLIEGWDPFESFYFIVITLTTIGFGDLCPQTAFGSYWWIVYCVLGLGLMAVLLSSISEWFSTLAQSKVGEMKAAAARGTVGPAQLGGQSGGITNAMRQSMRVMDSGQTLPRGASLPEKRASKVNASSAGHERTALISGGGDASPPASHSPTDKGFVMVGGDSSART